MHLLALAPTRELTLAKSNVRRPRRKPAMTTVSDPSDEALVADYARSRSAKAIETLVERHWGSSHRLALRALGGPGAAADAAQDAFVSLLRGASSFDPGKPFGPWFRALVLNSVRMHDRSRRARLRREHA